MRAWDVMLYCGICINLAIMLVSSLNIFGTGVFYYGQMLPIDMPQLNDINEFNVSGASQITDYPAQTSFGITSIGFIINAVMNFAAVYFPLVGMFGVPAPLALILQTVLYIIYALGILGWVTGRHPEAYP